MRDKVKATDLASSSLIIGKIKLGREKPKINSFLYIVLSLPIIYLILIPSIEVSSDFSIMISNKPILTPVLKYGHLYKVIIEGIRDPYSISDCLLKSDNNRYDSVDNFLSINNKSIFPDLFYPYCHKYVYYIPGYDRSIIVNLASSLIRCLFGNNKEGGIFLSVDEADFKLWVDDQPFLQSERIIFNYSLDPIPIVKDEIIMVIYDRNDNLVFKISNKMKLDSNLNNGDGLLTGMEMNNYVWYGKGNSGEWNSKLLPHGEYRAKLLFKRGSNEFLAFCPNENGDWLNIAITRRLSSDFPSVIQRGSSVGDLFPYITHRALKIVESVPDGLEDIYSKKDGIGNDFLYYSGKSILSDWLDYKSKALLSIQRTLNLIRASYWEFYGPEAVYPELLDMSGIYDVYTAGMVEWFRKKFNISSEKEVEILHKYDNLPPDYDQLPNERQLSYIIAGDTLKSMLNTTFKVRGIPTDISLADLDNFPAYDPDDRNHSLYHLFEEIGRRTISERKHRVLKSGEEEKEGIIYDISDDGFISMMIAICYQESGISHVTESGRVFRAGSGRGSATGYMQLTADVITYNNFTLTFPTESDIKKVKLGSFGFKDRYALRNINRSNLEIGAQFLKEMWYNIESERFNKRFKEEIKSGGLLSASDNDGFIKRVKLTSASYNAGPEAVRVILEYPYDNPDTKENESLKIFFDDYEADLEPYLKKFRDDLELRMKGKFQFPVERNEKGREMIDKLIKWLGPFWHKKFAGISWEEAALMKLDREVLGYIRNVSINTMRLIAPSVREKLFKERNFSMLIVKKEEEKEEIGKEMTDKEEKNAPQLLRPQLERQSLKE
ncbi:MAG: hypothetical protein ACUVWP_03675 [bacterium]